VSLVAKVFVVLNLLISVAFLVFSMNVWTAQTKWQKAFEEEKTKSMLVLGEQQKLQVGLSQEVVRNQQLTKEADAKTSAIRFQFIEERDKSLQTLTELAKAKNERDLKDAANEELVRELKRTYDDLTKLKGVVIKQQQAVVVERDNAQRARNEKTEMENDLNTTKQTLATLTRDRQQIEADLALQTARIEGLLARNIPVYELLQEDAGGTQPYISDAQVLAVRGDIGMVMLSVGSQQSVKPGYRFTISRGPKFIAQVQIDRVYPEMSSAKVVTGMVAANEEVQVHDEARSKK